jgi:hypothetical protein
MSQLPLVCMKKGGGERERPLLGFMFFHDLLSAIGDDGFRSWFSLISPLRVPYHCAFLVLLVMMGLGPSLV